MALPNTFFCLCPIICYILVFLFLMVIYALFISCISMFSLLFRRGRCAVVRKCVAKSTGQEYAAKFLKKRRRGQDCKAEILHEIAVLELMKSNPHVVNLHEVYETANEIILVLE